MKPRDKSMPILRYRKANPDASFEEIAEKFGRSRAAIYSLMYKHKLIDLPPEQPRLIIEDPFDIGHEIPVIPKPKMVNFEEFRIQHPQDLYSTPEPTKGQEILREEIKRLNDEINELRMMNECDTEMLADSIAEIEQLKNDNIGYRAVISYLEARINGIAV
jgi:hypothetical protein